MKRIRKLDRYPKALLGIMAIMVLGFTVAYIFVTNRNGFLYHDKIFVPEQENDTIVYSARFDSRIARFIIDKDNTLTFTFAERSYGPYTMKKDPSAVSPTDNSGKTGIELYCDDELIFRGSVLIIDKHYFLYNEDGSIPDSTQIITTDYSYQQDEYGNIIDPIKPTVTDLARFFLGPDLVHKGTWFGWFGGVVFCILNTLFIIFADELFRWHIALRVSYPEKVEPSDWEITSRQISWFMFAIGAAYLFWLGLQYTPFI